MKNLLSVLICLFVVSVGTTLAQWSNPMTASISSNYWQPLVQDNNSYVGNLPGVGDGETIHLHAYPTASVTRYSGTGTIEAHALGDYYANGSRVLEIKADASRSTAGSTTDSDEGYCDAHDTVNI